MAKKVVVTVPESRFDKYGIHFSDEWEITYLSAPYTDEELIKAIGDKEYLLVMATHPVTKTVIDACPNLKFIQSEGVAFNKIDIEAAKAKGVIVSNNKGANADAVAELTVALMLECYRTMAYFDRRLKSESFTAVKQDSLAAGVRELRGKHIGFVGMGAIAKEAAKRLQNWKVKMSYYDVFRPTPEQEAELGISYLPFEELVKECDLISMHIPVLPTTINMMGAEQFKAMKKTAMLINTARGEVVDQEALAAALEAGEIAHAGLDVLSPEPTPADHPLLNMSEAGMNRLTLTPHNGGMTDEAFITMLTVATENMERMEKGEEPINIVNR